MEQSVVSSPRRTSGGLSVSFGASPSLVDERFDHDSCGVGFVAAVNGAPSHEILQQALTALSRLAHRGATAADGKSSDGVGVMTAIPRALLVKATNLAIEEKQLLGVGMLFLPTEETRAEELLERCLLSHDFRVLCWRDVPICTEWLGEMALSTMPKIRQVLVVDSSVVEPETMERRLVLAR
jgi:glutamate synthase (NADPH/NADH) large chain